jgi:hypothetical protein
VASRRFLPGIVFSIVRQPVGTPALTCGEAGDVDPEMAGDRCGAAIIDVILEVGAVCRDVILDAPARPRAMAAMGGRLPGFAAHLAADASCRRVV